MYLPPEPGIAGDLLRTDTTQLTAEMLRRANSVREIPRIPRVIT
jgi:hypothetical protein